MLILMPIMTPIIIIKTSAKLERFLLLSITHGTYRSLLYDCPDGDRDCEEQKHEHNQQRYEKLQQNKHIKTHMTDIMPLLVLVDLLVFLFLVIIIKSTG